MKNGEDCGLIRAKRPRSSPPTVGVAVWVRFLPLYCLYSETACSGGFSLTKGGLEGGRRIRASPNFGDRVQHTGEGTGYRVQKGRAGGIGYNSGEKG